MVLYGNSYMGQLYGNSYGIRTQAIMHSEVRHWHSLSTIVRRSVVS